METKSAGSKLTVIVRDDAPLIHCGDMPNYRRVTLNLTPGQKDLLALKGTATSSGKTVFESVSNCFLEK